MMLKVAFSSSFVIDVTQHFLSNPQEPLTQELRNTYFSLTISGCITTTMADNSQTMCA